MTDPVTSLQEAFVLLDSFVEAHMGGANIPGLVIAVIDPDKLLEEPMVPRGNGVFRMGKEEHSSERIRFYTVLDRQALRAQLSCCDYYRTFAP